MSESLITPEQAEAIALVKHFEIQHKSVDETDIAFLAETTFLENLKRLKAFEAKIYAISVTSAEQVEEMKNCKEALPIVVALRTGSDKLKTAGKAKILKEGYAYDAINNSIEARCKKMEEHCKLNATFIERMEQAEYRRIGEARAAEMKHFGIALPTFEELGKFTQEMYNSFYLQEEQEHHIREMGKKVLAEKQEQERKEAIAKVEADRFERERLRAENAKLVAENARIQAERDKERKAIEAEKDALSKAGTGAKMLAFAAKLEAIEVPIIEGEEKAMEALSSILVRFVNYAREKYS